MKKILRRFIISYIYLYIYNNLTTPKQKQIDKKAERSIGYILAGTQKKKLRYTRDAACLRLNVYFMHKHRLDDSYIALRLR